MKMEIENMSNFETSYEFYQKDLEDASKKNDWSKLKLLTAKEIVDKIVKGDKDFSNVRIFGIDWARRDLSGFDFSGSKIEWCVFSGCKIKNSNFSGAFLDWCIFDSADLPKSNFKNSIVYDSIFSNSNLKDVDFSNSDLRWSLFANNVGRPDFKNCTQVGIFYSIEEAWKKIEEGGGIEGIKFFIQRAGLPIPQALMFKVKFNDLNSDGEKLRLFYDIGRDAINPTGNLGQYNLKQVGKPSLGEYGKRGIDEVYVAGAEYGKNTERKKSNAYSR